MRRAVLRHAGAIGSMTLASTPSRSASQVAISVPVSPPRPVPIHARDYRPSNDVTNLRPVGLGCRRVRGRPPRARNGRGASVITDRKLAAACARETALITSAARFADKDIEGATHDFLRGREGC